MRRGVVYALLGGFVLLAITPVIPGSATPVLHAEAGTSETATATAAATSIAIENMEETEEVELTSLFVGFYEERIPLVPTPGEHYVWVAPYINAVTTPPPEPVHIS